MERVGTVGRIACGAEFANAPKWVRCSSCGAMKTRVAVNGPVLRSESHQAVNFDDPRQELPSTPPSRHGARARALAAAVDL